MQTLDAIHGRKSTRAFLPTPVSRDMIALILEASRWAPSGSNRQQWRVTVASGETCKTLAAQLVEWAREQSPRLPGVNAAPAEGLQNATALRQDLEHVAGQLGMSLWEFVVAGSYRLYDAPVVIVVSSPGQRSADAAPFVTTLLLAAHDVGLGTCWLGYPLSCSEIIRRHLGIPEGERLSAVVAVGHPDPDSPANAYRSPRDDLASFVRWVGVEDGPASA